MAEEVVNKFPSPMKALSGSKFLEFVGGANIVIAYLNAEKCNAPEALYWERLNFEPVTRHVAPQDQTTPFVET